jgi:hypothetical protein
MKKCQEILGLSEIKRTGRVSPKEMLQCCERLIQGAEELGALRGFSVSVGKWKTNVPEPGFLELHWNFT